MGCLYSVLSPLSTVGGELGSGDRVSLFSAESALHHWCSARFGGRGVFIQCLVRSPPPVDRSVQVIACFYSVLSSLSPSGGSLWSGDSVFVFSAFQC